MKKPQEAQRAKALWVMKETKDRKEDVLTIRLAKTTFREKNAIGVVARTSQGSKCCAGQSIKVRCL